MPNRAQAIPDFDPTLQKLLVNNRKAFKKPSLSRAPSTAGKAFTYRIVVNLAKASISIAIALLFLSLSFCRAEKNTSPVISNNNSNPAPANYASTISPQPSHLQDHSGAQLQLSASPAKPQKNALEKRERAQSGKVIRDSRDIAALLSGHANSQVTLSKIENDSSTMTLATLQSPRYQGSIRRLSPQELELPQSLEPVYVDILINPEEAEQSTSSPSRNRSRRSHTNHTLLAGTIVRDDSTKDQASIDTGLQYSSQTETVNAGIIRINATVLEEDEDISGIYASNETSRQRGLRRLSVEQLNVPLSDEISLDNILGTHRSTRYRFAGAARGLINQRFGISDPDIAGITSRLRTDHNALTFSWGELGETQGSFLNGFSKTSGEVLRLQYDHASDSTNISSEIWQTSGSAMTFEERLGSRFNLTKTLSPELQAQLSLAQSSDALSAMTGLKFEGVNTQEIGAYFFDPEFVWIDTVIGDDSLGGFYQYYGAIGDNQFNLNAEHRRSGISNSASLSSNTSFLGASLATRLNRNTRISTFYSYRDRQYEKTINTNSSNDTEHMLRILGVVQHNANRTSNAGINLRSSDTRKAIEAHYNWRNTFNDDTELSIGTTAARETPNRDIDSDTSLRFGLQADISKNFANQSTLNLGVSIDHENRESGEISNSISGFISYDWSINPHLDLNLQIDHNQSELKTDDVNVGNTLFTTSSFDSDNASTSFNSTNALITLRYNFGGGAGSKVLAQRRGSRGAGAIRGRLFLDENHDGIAQDQEPGLAGITVYLDSVYPAVTNARGEFFFRYVATGNHHIYLDEGTLPLPWTLSGTEFYKTSVSLRGESKVEIAVSELR